MSHSADVDEVIKVLEKVADDLRRSPAHDVDAKLECAASTTTDIIRKALPADARSHWLSDLRSARGGGGAERGVVG